MQLTTIYKLAPRIKGAAVQDEMVQFEMNDDTGRQINQVGCVAGQLDAKQAGGVTVG